MNETGWAQFAGQRVLLLQGPVGPFFARLARDLRAAGAQVWKVNFHAGDQVFFPGGIVWRGQPADWPIWLEKTLRTLAIDRVLLFGDCRPIHLAARAVCARLGVPVGVFEEGYFRPHHVTFEWGGVNADSPLPHDFADLEADDEVPAPSPIHPVPRAFARMAWWAFVYFTTGALLAWRFPHYVHHRPLHVLQAWPWLRSAWRKPVLRWAERGILARLTGPASRRWFLVPLQVHNDAQVLHHAATGGITGFIASTIASFARHAPPDCLLVIKHHPMDRGYRDYRALIADEALRHGCHGRVITLHDQPTPVLLDHCRGVITINSTVGLSALVHGRPTKALGDAIYDLPGLTYQGPLHRFWHEAATTAPDPALTRRFQALLLARSQINGSFYRRLVPGSATGLAAAPSGMRRTATDRRFQPVQPRDFPRCSTFIKGMTKSLLL